MEFGNAYNFDVVSALMLFVNQQYLLEVILSKNFNGSINMSSNHQNYQSSLVLHGCYCSHKLL